MKWQNQHLLSLEKIARIVDLLVIDCSPYNAKYMSKKPERTKTIRS